MAKYIGLLSSDARGKLGGMVMSRARGATTLKAHAVPRLNPSLAQNLQRVRMAAAVGVWRTLSGASQTTWAVYAATQIWTNSLGTTYSPTGLQLYTQAFINGAYLHAKPPANLNPATIQPPPIIGLTLTDAGTAMNVTATGSSGAYDGYWLLWASAQIPQSRNYTKTIARKFMAAVLGGAIVDISAPYTAGFGRMPTPSNWYCLRALPFDPNSLISGTNNILNVQVKF